MEETWIRWEPIVGLTGKYDVDVIIDNREELRIRLYCDTALQKKIDIVFAHHADAYQHTNESFRLASINALAKNHTKDFYSAWTFFKLQNSTYLQWFSNESLSYSDEFVFHHFCLLGSDSIVDILARYEPMVIVSEESIL